MFKGDQAATLVENDQPSCSSAISPRHLIVTWVLGEKMQVTIKWLGDIELEQDGWSSSPICAANLVAMILEKIFAKLWIRLIGL